MSKKMIRTNTVEICQDWWEASPTGRETYGYFPTIHGRGRIQADWNHYSTQYLSGYRNFKAKLNKFALKEDLWCQNCGQGTEESAWHMLVECPEYEKERTELSEVWRGIPLEDRRTKSVKKKNFNLFERTAKKVGKKKEGRSVGRQFQ